MITWWMRIIFAACFLACSSEVLALTRNNHIELLDARTWDFSKRLPLRGNWNFIENKLVSPEAIDKEDFSTTIFFPSLWNDRRPDRQGLGTATYVLNVLVPDSLRVLAIEIPQLYSSYNLWVDGNLISSAGVPGVKSDSVIPKWVYQTITFTAKSDTIQIVLQLANFHHYKEGSINPMYLGTADHIESHFKWAIGSNAVEAIVLFLEGIFFLFFYRLKKKSVVLYFALLCLTWSVRSVFSHLYPVVLIAPDFPWQLLVKIEYITLYLTVIWAALFFNSLFKDISNVVFTYLPIVINLFFIVFTLFTPAIVFTRWISVYLGVAVLVILYGVALIVRALIIEREGSWFLMISIWIGVLLFGYDIAAYHGSFSYNALLLNIGYVSIFMLTTAALLVHMGVIKSNTEVKKVLTYNDLFQESKKR